MGAEVVDGVAVAPEHGLDGLFVSETGVIGAERDAKQTRHDP
jgi:hypothetical protein